MYKRIVNFIHTIFSHKEVFFCIAIFVLLFSFVPFHVAQAGFWSGLINAITDGIAGLFAGILGVVAGVLAGIFFLLSSAFFVIIKYFLSSTVTPGAVNTPEFVETSFNIVRQLVNMFFILILVFIGLATILRLQTYELKKTLPLLLIMALLVNFSGVFVGFIVDMANLPAHYFLDLARGDWDAIKNAFNPPGSGAEKLGTVIASILYFLVATLIYFVLIFVFAIRTMFLWLLVILAPLAFASYILPATRGKIWNEWWQQLVQWSIFVIPITFFMFLAQAALTGIGNPLDLRLEEGTADEGITFLRKFLAPFTALFILYIGVTVSQQMAPAAAKSVADFGKKWGGRAGMAAGTAALRFRGAGKFKAEKGIGENLQEWGQRARIFGEKMPGTGGGGGGFVARWAGRGLELTAGEINRRMSEKDNREFDTALSEATHKKSEDLILQFLQEKAKGMLGNKNRMAAILTRITLNNDSDDIEDKFLDKGTIQPEDIKNSIETGRRFGAHGHRPLQQAFGAAIGLNPKAFGYDATPVDQAGNPTNNPEEIDHYTGKDAKKMGDMVDHDFVARIEAGDIRTNFTPPMNIDTENDMELGSTGITKGDVAKFFGRKIFFSKRPELLAGLYSRREREAVRAMAEYLQQIPIEQMLAEELERNLIYMAGTGGQAAGIFTPLTLDDTKEVVRLHKKSARMTPAELIRYNQLIENWNTSLPAIWTPPTGFTPPPGWTPGDPPPGWTSGTPVPPGWTFAPP